MCQPTPIDMTQKALGQYFTVAHSLQQFVFDHVKHRGSELLEPSFGAGHLLALFKQSDPDYPMTCYELDATIEPIVSFNEHQTCVYGDFTTAAIGRTFRTIIGNPPYVKQSSGNLYLTFIRQCHSYLADDGELLFIVPSEFLKLTAAGPLLDAMVATGSFTHFYFPHDERLFEGASVDVVIFRYEKGLHTTTALVNGVSQTVRLTNGILTFGTTASPTTILGSLVSAHVGLVSGRDSVYRVPFGETEILTDLGTVQTFIFPSAFPTGNRTVDAHLLAHKDELLQRKIRAFSEANWFEWGAPRNLAMIRANWGKPCLYVRTLTRHAVVAVQGTVQYYGASLICLLPRTEIALEKVCEALNSPEFRSQYTYSGRFKIGHKQLENAHVLL